MPDTSKTKAKAMDALNKGNYEYAITIMQEILVVDPGDVDTRKQLRLAGIRNVKQKGISPFSAKLKGAGTLASIKFGKDPEKKMRDCEKYLTTDPSNKFVLTELGKAALAAGHAGTGVWVFEELARDRDDDPAVLRLLADAYEEGGEVEKAIEVNQRLLKKKPSDQIASRKVKDLAARRHTTRIQETAIHGSARDQLANRKQQEGSEKRRRDIRTDEDVQVHIDHYLEEIKGRPDDPRLYSQLGDMYLRFKQKRFDRAEEAIKKAMELAPTDNTYKVKLDDMEIRKRQAAVARLQKGSAEYNRKAFELLKYKQERLEWRVSVYSVELNYRFDLGNTYYQLGQLRKDKDMFRKAITCYQKTVGDPKNRSQSRLRLGQARARLKEYDLAIEEFTEGIENLELMNQDKMDMIYWRADTRERNGDREKAIEDFTAIYKINIEFRDVSDRLAKLKG